LLLFYKAVEVDLLAARAGRGRKKVQTC